MKGAAATVHLDLNELLVALAYAIDLVEIDVLGTVSNHSRRVAYLSARTAANLGASPAEVFEIVSLALLHDNGLAESSLWRRAGATGEAGAAGESRGAAGPTSPGAVPSGAVPPGGGPVDLDRVEGIKDHCVLGEKIIEEAPFDGRHRTVILYHHENHDGTGFFGIPGSQVPLFARIIHAADSVALAFDLRETTFEAKRDVSRYLDEGKGSRFAPEVVIALQRAMRRPAFWMDLREEHVEAAVQHCSRGASQDLDVARLREITRTFSRIIDAKSRFTRRHSQGLMLRAARMAARYGWSPDDSTRLAIAAELHDIGKLTVPVSVLDKPAPLSPSERDVVENHTYYTRMTLRKIRGFEQIAEWASNHHERLDGSGYPFGLAGTELDRGSRLMAALDCYQGLTEDRPYREALSHDEAVGILRRSAAAGQMDPSIVQDIAAEFG